MSGVVFVTNFRKMVTNPLIHSLRSVPAASILSLRAGRGGNWQGTYSPPLYCSSFQIKRISNFDGVQ